MSDFIRSNSKIWASLASYFIIVACIMLCFGRQLFLSYQVYINWGIFLIIFLVCQFLKGKISEDNRTLFTIILVYSALTVLYKETALFNRLFYPSIDESLILADQRIFGFQPSLEFSKHFNSFVISEIMYFGYFSYYLMPVAVLFILYKQQPKKLEEFGFLVITSFLFYYIIFIFLPAFGPQFYLTYPDNFVEAKGFFGHFIKIIQENGEAKTAAFPSSHVGVAVIMLIWIFKNLKKYFKYFVPIVITLFFATVYIKAHYAVDAIAGLLSAPFIYLIINHLFKKLTLIYGNSN